MAKTKSPTSSKLLSSNGIAIKFFGIYAQQSYVSRLITPHQLGLKPSVVFDNYFYILATFDNVIIGDHVAASRIDNDTGPGCLSFPPEGPFRNIQQLPHKGLRNTGLSTTSTFLVEMLTTPGTTAFRTGATEGLPNSAIVPAGHAIGTRKNGSTIASHLLFVASIKSTYMVALLMAGKASTAPDGLPSLLR
jgi:hypothetical protein